MERHRLVLVSATPGAGKTTAVVAAMQDRMHDVAWLSVDITDAAPGRLLAYLAASRSGRAERGELLERPRR